MLESIPDGVEDNGIGDHLVPVSHRELRCEGDRLIDGSFFDDFAQILRFGCGKFPHSHLVKNYEIELGEFCAIAKVAAAGTGDGKVFLERGDAHVEHRLSTWDAQ